MKAGWLVLVAMLGPSASAIASSAALTSTELNRALDAHGARAVVEQVGDRLDSEVLRNIDSGASTWVAVAARLAPGVDAGHAEGLTIALAYALPKNPRAVLSVANDDDGLLSIQRVCAAPFIEQPANDLDVYRRDAIRAVQDLHDIRLRPAQAHCLATLANTS